MNALHQDINTTYGSKHLARRLLENLQSIGLDLENLSTNDLMVFDELHTMGRQATLELGRLAQLQEHTKVIDIGCGLGGPARSIAQCFGCHVTGVDLSNEFIETADVLSKQAGLENLVTFDQADALNLPFENNKFDVAMMIHMNMNILDKDTLFKQAHRVLKNNGMLVLWEICKGENDQLVYPVPWAETPEFSFLESFENLINKIRSAGFSIQQKTDASKQAKQWVRERLEAAKTNTSKLCRPNLDLVLNNFRIKRANASHNLMKGAFRVMRAAAVK
ncbi:MAG: methyltransferase domain-containing protein [Desulfobacteraceae bacterium]|nr:methyltransferase domain-containing protein [Desulfobacteraceae bacterium]